MIGDAVVHDNLSFLEEPALLLLSLKMQKQDLNKQDNKIY